VGRPEKPVDPDAGPVQRFAWQLRQLRESSGSPSYRALSRKAHFSVSTLADAAKGERLPSLEVTLGYVAACGGDIEQWRLAWTAATDALAAADAPDRFTTPERERCPYPGLAPLQAEHGDRFFGRSRLLERLLDRVERLPLVALFGASGSGKSSLLRAGLLGRIGSDQQYRQRWRTMVMTPGEHPLAALADQVAKVSGEDVARVRASLTGDAGVAALDVALRGVLASGPAGTRALLVVDQFEEVFTVCRDAAERARFLALVLDAVGSTVPAGADIVDTPDGGRRTSVVLGVRADVLGRLAEHPELVDALGDEAYLLVGPVTAADLREIIVRPAALAGLTVAPDLVATIVADADEQPGSLPLVSHALQETWQHRESARLTLTAYQASGGVRGAIAQTAERVYARFSPTEQAAARRIFPRLTALGEGTEDTRRPIGRAELDGVAEPVVVTAVVEALADARLVVLDEDTVEVAHEALIRAWPRLHRWLTDDRATLVVHRRLTEATRTWEQLDTDAGALYRGAQLVAAQSWAQDHPGDLNQSEAAFLRASGALARAEAERDRRRVRLFQRLVAAVSVLLVLALAGGGYALVQRGQARGQEVDSLAAALALRSRSVLATDPDLAGLLAVQADHLRPGPETLGAMLSVASAPPRLELNADGSSVSTIAFNADHTRLAAAGVDGSISIWDPHTGARLSVLRGLSGRAVSVAFSRDGSLVAASGVAASGGGAILVWDGRSGQTRQHLTEAQLTSAMSFSGDGTRIAVSSAGGDIVVHDLTDGSRRVLHSSSSGVTSVSFSADATLLAAATGSGDPVVWNVATGQVRTQLTAPHAYTVAFATTGTVLAASADDKGVYLWDLAGAAPTRLPDLPLAGGYGWSISAPTGDELVVGDEAGQVTLWDFRRRLRIATYADRGRSETETVSISPDGALLASAGFHGSIVVHDLGHTPFTGFAAQVTDVKVSPDGTLVATAGDDGAVRLWDRHGDLQATLDGHPDQVAAVAFSPDGALLAAVTRNMTITLWDVRSRTRVVPTLHPSTLGASTDVAFSPSGTTLVVATLGVRLWDVHDPARPVDRSATVDSRLTTTFAVTPDGKRLIGSSVGGFLNVWDLGTGKLLSRIDAGSGALQDIALSPDGTVLATAGDSRVVTLWDAATLRPLARLTGHTAPVQVLAFSRDGRTLASAGDDHTVRVWDVASRQLTASLTGHTARIRGLAFTPDGTLISGAEDGRVIAWILDARAAAHLICQRVGRDLTPAEWAANLPSEPYQKTCAGSDS
jgi:WD40 repeat protein